MALKLPLKNGSYLLKSQEPSPSLLVPPPPTLSPFHPLFMAWSIYAINSPFHFMDMESPERFSIQTTLHALLACSTTNFQHVWGSLHHLPTWLQNLGSYKKMNTRPSGSMQHDLSSGHFVYQRKAMQISHANRSPVTYQKWSRNTVNLFLPLQHQPLVHL